MEIWGVLLIFLGVGAALFALDRFALWLEKRGLLYYRSKKPDSSPLGCMVALQQIIEPPAIHVLYIKEQKRHAKEEAPGEDMSGEKPLQEPRTRVPDGESNLP
jgi:hypothetical protein